MTSIRRSWPTVAGAFVLSQVLAVVGWIVATIVTRDLRGGDFRPPEYHGFLGWTSWDGGFYRVIAEHGYLTTNAESIRFFPLYPLAARPLRLLLGGNTDLALFLIAKVSVVVALFGVYELLRSEGHSDPTARRGVWFLVLFPGAFVFAWAYSEPMLLAFVTWGIWALRKQRWWTAALLGLAAGLCRPVGVALAVAALVEVLRSRPPLPRGTALPRVAAIVAAPLGVITFCGYAAWRGFGFWAPFRIQDELRGNQTPLERLWSIPSTLTGSEASTTGLHVPFVLGFLVLLVVAFRKLPSTYGWFAATILVAALSAENMNSIERYATSAFPLAMAGALVVERHERFEPAVYAAGGALAVAFCTLALTGSFVP